MNRVVVSPDESRLLLYRSPYTEPSKDIIITSNYGPKKIQHHTLASPPSIISFFYDTKGDTWFIYGNIDGDLRAVELFDQGAVDIKLATLCSAMVIDAVVSHDGRIYAALCDEDTGVYTGDPGIGSS